MKIFTPLLVLLLALTLAGCGKILNPYSEEFGCPGGDYGSCTDVTAAYEKSFKENDETFSPMVKVNIDPKVHETHATPGSKDKDDLGANSTTNSNSIVIGDGQGEIYDHQTALLTELQGVISDEKTPMLLPSKQMRLLVLGYEDDHKSYYGHRFVYFIAEPEHWILPTNRIGIPMERPETLFRQ